MERAAGFGRGTFTSMGSPTEVEGKMTDLQLNALCQASILMRWPASNPSIRVSPLA